MTQSQGSVGSLAAELWEIYQSLIDCQYRCSFHLKAATELVMSEYPAGSPVAEIFVLSVDDLNQEMESVRLRLEQVMERLKVYRLNVS